MDRDDRELDDRTDPLGVKILSSKPRRPRGLERRMGLNRLFAAVLGDDEVEARFGRFVIDRKRGEGGMGQLYRGFDPDSGRPVAIKVGMVADTEEIGRLRREANRLKELSHPRIVRYLDDGVTDEGQHYLVMEWLDGFDLARRLRKQGPLDGPNARNLGFAAAEGLAAAHAADIVHRDVKPSNVFMVDGNPHRVRVLDFGIARTSTGEDTDVTGTGILVGTPSCMAPEQVEGEWSQLTDVYGLGGTLFEALTGRSLFPGDNPTEVLLAVMGKTAPHVRSFAPDVDPRLDDLVFRMVAKKPAARPQGMQAVLDELADL
jgi:serine/threonine protein kinase